MVRAFFKRRFLFPKGVVQSGEAYYLVDWDLHIKGSGHKTTSESNRRSQKFHRELIKLLKVKRLKDYTSSGSVLPVETLELAMKVAELAVKYGGKANVREAKTIQTFKASEVGEERPGAQDR